jgi:hypothetical protein
MKLSLFKKRGLALLLPLFCLLLVNCGTKREAQPDCGFVQNVYGERISWKDSAAIPLYIHESFPAAMLPALQKAMARWDLVLGRTAFRIAQTGYQSSSPAQDGVNVMYWLKTWEANKTTEQARTSVYWVGDQIKEADIRINSKNFNFYLDTATAGNSVHLESLLVHELGHVLGLKHRDEAGSVMATYLAAQTQRTNISKVDVQDLKCEY